jgi:hypothetical protein
LFVLQTGQVSGLIKEVKSAKEIFNNLVSGAVSIWKGCRIDGISIDRK